jgi:O-antigen/teichoic acid export membrane protein
MIKLGEFSRNVLLILGGTVAAQAIGIVVSPVLTRLYSPADFGVYALFMSFLAILGSVACGRYEYGITLPAENRQGLALLALCTVVALGVSLFILPLALLGGDLLAAISGEPKLRPWLLYIPAALFFTGFSSGARYWLLRTKAFKVVSLNGVLRTSVGAIFNIAFGLLGWVHYGLIGGLLFSLLVGASFFAIQIWLESSEYIKQLRWIDLRDQAYAQRKFPKYSTGSALIEAGAAQVPVFFFSSLFGASALGYFSLAQRIANLPLALVAGSVGDVFRQQASEVFAKQAQCSALFKSTFVRLFWLSLPAFGIAAWISPWLFAKVFGEGWRESGEYVRILVPALALRFVSSPLSSMFYIAGRQAMDLIIQAVLIVIMVAIFWWAGRHESEWTARRAVLAYSAIYSVKYLIELGLSWKFARGGAEA